MLRRWLWVVFAAAPLWGCGEEFETEGDDATSSGGDPIEQLSPAELTPGNVRVLTNASAPKIFYFGIALYGAVGTGSEGCPKTTHDGDTTIYEGGCVTMDGKTLSGKAIAQQTPTDVVIDYESFGYAQSVDCMGVPVEQSYAFDGRFSANTIEPGKGVFQADLTIESSAPDPGSCALIDRLYMIDYEGALEGMPDDGGGIALEGRTSWHGSGRVGEKSLGRANASTANEVLDNALCPYEALSGTTTLESAGSTAVLTYDGEIDCEVTSTVMYSINGGEPGELTGVACAMRGRGGNDWAWPFVLLWLVRSPWRRANRRSRAPSCRAAGASLRTAEPTR